MRWKKIFGFGCLGILAFLVIGAGALWYFNPFNMPIEVAEPGEDGIRVDENGLLANYYAGKGDGQRPAILLLGGSEGGITKGSSDRARELARLGYSVLYPGYYRTSKANKDFDMVPLETFDKALEWLKNREEVDENRLAVIGGSKGAEAALIIASENPEIKAVVAGMPSNVVWQGFSFGSFDMSKFQSSWSRNGKPVPYLPYGEFEWSGDIGAMYDNSLKALDDHPDAIIKIENTSAPVLLICGEQDTLWPSCDMARSVQSRAKEKGQPEVTLLAYEDAGHAVFGTPRPEDDPDFDQLGSIGGTPEGNNAARKDGWPKVLAFLERHLLEPKD